MTRAKNKDVWKNPILVQTRKQLGLTCRQLAEQAGLIYGTYAAIEGLRDYPSKDLGERLIGFLNSRGANLNFESVFPEDYREFIADNRNKQRAQDSQTQKLEDITYLMLLPEYYNSETAAQEEIESNEQMVALLNEALEELPSKLKTIIYQRYFTAKEPYCKRGASHRKIGASLGLGSERTRQLELKAIEQLKAKLTWKLAKNRVLQNSI